MKIRQMKKSDIIGVADLELACFGKRDVENIEKTFANKNYNYIIADLDGSVVGFCVFLETGDDAEIIVIGVDGTYRNRGIGVLLSQKMIEIVKKKNKKAIFLEVRKSNLSAIGLYTKLGFEPISIRKKYYEGVEDAIVMRLGLK